MSIFNKFARKGKLFVAGAIVAVAMTTALTFGLAPAKANAAGCDQVNIIHCGLDGSSASGYVNSFKSFYTKGSDNGHSDLQAIYNWAGLSDADVSGMNTTNTKVGTLYRNGDIKVDGQTVASDAWVSARFTEGSGFIQVKDGVWARKTTTSLKYDSYTVIVHFNSDGSFDSAVMVECGNAVKATNTVKPPKPAPKPALKCELLKGAASSAVLTYSFTATASASNTKIESYVFNFGDGKTSTVATDASTAGVNHTFTDYSKSYKVTVAVNGADQKNVTGSGCAVTITTPPAPVKPALVCKSLGLGAVANQALTYKFTATAAATKTTITNYVFNFGDNKTQTVTTGAATASAEHTFPTYNKQYTITVVVNSTDVKNVTSVTCKVQMTTPPQPCVPKVGEDKNCQPTCVPTATQDKNCVEVPETVVTCVPTATQDENCVEKPTTLVNTGPGAVAGLFAGTSAIGAAAHQVISRRRRSNRE